MLDHAGLKVFGYARVSTDEQVLRGKSLIDQPEKIRSFCEAHGLHLVDILKDEGECSKTLERPALQRILKHLREGDGKGIVVAYLDRLTRNVGDICHLIDEFFTQPDGCHLFSCEFPVDTRSAFGRTMVIFLILMSQFQRELIVEKTVGAMDGKRKRSERTGNLRFGMTTDPQDQRRSKAGNPVALVFDLEELALEAEILAMSEKGLSTRAIAAELNSRGIPSKRGVTKRSTGRWSHSTVAAILKRSCP